MADKKWLKIGETAALVGVTPKDLRYWEVVIPEIKPRRSRGNLRYYHVDELPRLQRIQGWLREGLTVADCRELLEKGATAPPARLAPSPVSIAFLPEPAPPPGSDETKGPGEWEPVAAALKSLLVRLSERPSPSEAPAAPAPRTRVRKPLPPPPDTPPLPLD